MKFYEITIKAFIHLRSTENGGRKGYILSGYRPNFLFEENINHLLFGSTPDPEQFLREFKLYDNTAE